jgi:hypothetical protein
MGGHTTGHSHSACSYTPRHSTLDPTPLHAFPRRASWAVCTFCTPKEGYKHLLTGRINTPARSRTAQTVTSQLFMACHVGIKIIINKNRYGHKVATCFSAWLLQNQIHTSAHFSGPIVFYTELNCLTSFRLGSTTISARRVVGRVVGCGLFNVIVINLQLGPFAGQKSGGNATRTAIPYHDIPLILWFHKMQFRWVASSLFGKTLCPQQSLRTGRCFSVPCSLTASMRHPVWGG